MTIEHHKSIKINVVIPSHVRALATQYATDENFISQLSDPLM